MRVSSLCSIVSKGCSLSPTKTGHDGNTIDIGTQACVGRYGFCTTVVLPLMEENYTYRVVAQHHDNDDKEDKVNIADSGANLYLF